MNVKTAIVAFRSDKNLSCMEELRLIRAPVVFMIDIRIETGVLNVIIIAASELNILIRRERNFLVDTG